MRQHHGTKDYRETDWVSTEEEAVKALHLAVHTVPSSSGHNPTSGLKPAGNSYAGRVRMNLSSSSHFGKQVLCIPFLLHALLLSEDLLPMNYRASALCI